MNRGVLPVAECVEAQDAFQCWPVHNIAITNSVWCMAYKGGGGGGGGGYIAQKACNSIALGYALQERGGNTRMIDSHIEALK